MTEGSLFAHAKETHWVDHVQTAMLPISYHPHYVAVRLHWSVILYREAGGGGGAITCEIESLTPSVILMNLFYE